MTQIHAAIIVSGRVQGVGFRSGAKHKAKQLNLSCSAENTLDGKVNIKVEGEEKNVEEFFCWCQHGPPLAKVDQFSIRKT